MAETIHLFLKANGNDIQAESTQTSLGRENSIECLSFEFSVATALEARTGMATGRRQYQPILIRKRIDKSSPLLFKTLAENQVVTGKFLFFRPNPTGDGTTEQFYTIEFKQGRIASLRNYVPDTLSQFTANHPPLEEVTFVFHTIKLTYTNGGVEHEDNWSAMR